MSESLLFQSDNVKVSALPFQLNFKFPFKLALGTRSYTDIVILKIQSRSFTVYGEAALPPYLGATVKSTIDFYKKLDWNLLLESTLDEARAMIDLASDSDNAAKTSVSIALHDLHCQKENISLADFYRIEALEPSYSTYTIGISNDKELRQKLAEGADFKIIKLKLGSNDDKALIKSFKKHSQKPFCVDVNQGYTSRDYTALMSEFLLKSGALFIEQPLPATHYEEMAWVRERIDIPFVADESVKRLSDLPLAAEAFNGVNIKLMKSTGISEAFDMIHHSRKLNLKVILGAMAESSLGNTAAAHFASLADWIDLDGPMLTSNDPFDGIKYQDGALVLPERPGVGAKLKSGVF